MFTHWRYGLACASVAVVSIGGAAQATPQHAAKVKHKRTQTITYTYAGSESLRTPGPSAHFCVYSGDVKAFTPCFDFSVPAWAKFMSVSGTDATGQPTPIVWEAKLADGVSTDTDPTFVCGAAKNATVTPGSGITISVEQVSSHPECVGAATTGTLKIVLSNRR